MYNSVKLQNFRCFDDVSISSLARINLISGRNGVGKTSLLEALWLLSNPTDPEFALKLSKLRNISVDTGKLFSDLFHNFDVTKNISLSAVREENNKFFKLNISSVPINFTTLTTKDANKSALSKFLFSETGITGTSKSQIIYEYVDENENLTTSSGYLVEIRHRHQGQVTEINFITDGVKRESQPKTVFLPTSIQNEADDVNRFSSIKKIDYDEKIISYLKTVNPKIQDLTILAVPAPHIAAKMEGIQGYIPTNLLGNGFCRFLSMALAFHQAQNGVLLIDEVENGLHHTALRKIWKNLFQLSLHFNVQIFATTHSIECLNAARKLFSESNEQESADQEIESHLLFHRLNAKNGKISSTTYEARIFSFALEQGVEIR